MHQGVTAWFPNNFRQRIAMRYLFQWIDFVAGGGHPLIRPEKANWLPGSKAELAFKIIP
jgi:hypothetical protein